MPSVEFGHQNAFHPVLLNSEPLELTSERRMWIRKVLDTASSDSQFAQKAYDAIVYILTAPSIIPPVVTSLSPSSAALGSPNFTLHVNGTDFTPTSFIIWQGSPEPTIFVSESELTTEVNMATAQVAIDITVAVENPDGIISDPIIFSLTPAAADPSVSKQVVTEPEVKKGPTVSSWTDVTKK